MCSWQLDGTMTHLKIYGTYSHIVKAHPTYVVSVTVKYMKVSVQKHWTETFIKTEQCRMRLKVKQSISWVFKISFLDFAGIALIRPLTSAFLCCRSMCISWWQRLRKHQHPTICWSNGCTSRQCSMQLWQWRLWRKLNRRRIIIWRIIIWWIHWWNRCPFLIFYHYFKYHVFL